MVRTWRQVRGKEEASGSQRMASLRYLCGFLKGKTWLAVVPVKTINVNPSVRGVEFLGGLPQRGEGNESWTLGVNPQDLMAFEGLRFQDSR